MVKILISFFLFIFISVHGQTTKPTFALWDGALVMGYVDQGGFLNFTGPNVSLSKGHSKWMLGMLPSLRFKEDPSTPHNAPIFPSLGSGLTYSYKLLVVQVPMYYNPKTLTANGRWSMGLGLGLRFSYLNKKKS
jgi:hypothetical protein